MFYMNLIARQSNGFSFANARIVYLPDGLIWFPHCQVHPNYPRIDAISYMPDGVHSNTALYPPGLVTYSI